MAPVVELKVQDLAQAAQYYEGLLAVSPQGQANGTVTLVGDHVTLKLSAAAPASAADISLRVTCGMLARVLDAAMGAKCQISVKSPEMIQLTDRFGQRWTLQCK